MSEQNELTFLMVKLTGSDETIKQSVAAVVRMIHNELMPASPPPAIAAETSAALPAPVHGGELSPPAGGERHAATASSEEPAVPRRRQRRTPPSAPASIAAPAQSPASPASVPGSAGRGTSILLECQEKPGRTFTLYEAAALAKRESRNIHDALHYAKVRSKEWANVGAFHFKRSTTTLTPPSPPAAINKVGVVPMNFESKPRARGEISSINPNVVGRAAVLSQADHG